MTNDQFKTKKGLSMFAKILVALDASSQAPAIFDFALSIAQPGLSKLLLLHLIDWQIPEVSPWVGIGTLYDVNVSSDRYNWNRQHLQQEIEQSKIWLKSYAQKAISHNIDCEFECRLGSCNLGIGDRAKEWNADVIVIGRRGRGNISELILGSVSNYVIHHAPCSVLVVQGTKTSEIGELSNLTEHKSDNSKKSAI